MRRLLEVCVDDAVGLQAALSGGADRIELCSALSVGGLTPSPGLMALAAKAPVPVYAMVRPRAGDFVYDAAEVQQMLAEITAIRHHGLAGVVLGASNADGTLDRITLSKLLEAAEGLPATLHRAIDLTPDPCAAVEIAIDLGFERILSSGGAQTAVEGLPTLIAMQARAAGRIAIMPGSGISTETVPAILSGLPGVDIHASCASSGDSPSGKVLDLGFATGPTRRTDAGRVRALKAMLSQ